MIELRGVSKEYRSDGRVEVPALEGIDLVINRGEMVAVIGPSGSGTSTLLNILGCLDTPSAGSYTLDGVDVGRLSARRRTRLRGRTVGFVFATFELVDKLDVQHNVELPLMYTRPRARRARARAALERVGLDGHEQDMPVELFDAQRRALLIARALVNDPPLLLDEEPVGDLHPDSAREVMQLYTRLHEAGRTIVYATHREETAGWAGRIVELDEGRIVSDRPTGRPPRLRAV